MLSLLNKSIILLKSFKGNVGFIRFVNLNFGQQKNLKTKKSDIPTNLNLKDDYSNINTPLILLLRINKLIYWMLKTQNNYNLVSI